MANKIKTWPEYTEESGILETQVNDFQSFNSLLGNNIIDVKENYIFRGQRRCDWKLESTFLRTIKSRKDRFESPNIHLEHFKKYARGRRGTNPPRLTDEELWSLGQHFGLSTPLLDWTTSPYVALFFAFVNSSDFEFIPEDRVVFGINKSRIKELCALRSLDTDELKIVEPMLDENPRLLSQSGVFTFTKKLISIEEWIKTNIGNYEQMLLVKIRLPDSIRNSILKHLNWMNINYLTLFPDIEGAARHANLRIQIPGY